MNPAFVLIILLGIALLWLCLSGIYRLIGKIFLNIYNDAVDVISGEDEEKECNKNA